MREKAFIAFTHIVNMRFSTTETMIKNNVVYVTTTVEYAISMGTSLSYKYKKEQAYNTKGNATTIAWHTVELMMIRLHKGCFLSL